MGLPVRLGANIDHIATVRNARGGWHPDPVMGAKRPLLLARMVLPRTCAKTAAIRDADIFRLKESIDAPLNFEMAASDEMIAIADVHPNACCLVPEKREEVTTEGGLDVAAGGQRLWTKFFGSALGRGSACLSTRPDAVEQSAIAAQTLLNFIRVSLPTPMIQTQSLSGHR